LGEVKIGQWPQGVAWSRDGKTLLAQSMYVRVKNKATRKPNSVTR
jgi:hypothetical protein